MVELEKFDLKGHELIKMDFGNGVQFAAYNGRAGENNIQGNALLGAVEALHVCEQLGLKPISFEDYTHEIRLSKAWSDAHDEMRERRKAAGGQKVSRPEWLELVKDIGQVHTDRFMIHIPEGKEQDVIRYIGTPRNQDDQFGLVGLPDDLESGLYEVPIRLLDGNGEIFYTRIQRVRNDPVKALYIDMSDAKRLEPEVLRNLLGDRLRDDCPDIRVSGYFPVTKEGIDLVGKLSREDLREASDERVRHVTAHFVPGFCGPMGTGGYFRSRMAPDLNMAYVGKRNLLLELPEGYQA